MDLLLRVFDRYPDLRVFATPSMSMLDDAKRWFEASTVICRFVPDGERQAQKVCRQCPRGLPSHVDNDPSYDPDLRNLRSASQPLFFLILVKGLHSLALLWLLYSLCYVSGLCLVSVTLSGLDLSD